MERTDASRIGHIAVVVAMLVGVLVVEPAGSTEAGAAGSDYRDTVLADNPVAYWRLGDAAGTVAADEVGTLDGTYEGSPGLGQSGLVTDDDTAASFDGIDDLVAIPDSALINQGTHTQRTIEAWFQVVDSDPRQVVFEEGGGGRGLSIYVDQGSVYVAGWNSPNDSSADTPWGGVFLSAPITAGAPHHVVLVLDQPAATITGYLDGASIGSSPAGTLHSHGSDTGIGAMNDSTLFHDGIASGDGFYFSGIIDEVAIYNTSLSAATVAAHYAAGSSAAVDPTVAFVAPGSGAVVAGTVTVEVAASDPQDPPSLLAVEISTDGGASFAPAAFDVGSQTHSLGWDTTTTGDGPVTIIANVTDGDLNSGSSSLGVTVRNNPTATVYRDTVLADAPDVYYRLGEAAGTTAIDEVGSLDAPYVGSPVLGGPGLVGDSDAAAAFTGSDYVAVPDSGLINQGIHEDRTVEAWFAVDSTAARQVVYEEGGGGRGLNIYVDQGAVYMGGWNLSGQVWGPIFLSSPVNAGETYYVALVLAGGGLEAFVNGASIGSDGNAGTLLSHTSDVGIGAMNDATRFPDGNVTGDGLYFSGVIDEVAVYNTALSAATVAAHYQAGAAATPQDPSVGFFVPVDGATVAGTVLVEVVASDPQDSPDLLGVDVSFDGGVTFSGAVFNAASGRHELSWDTASGSDGAVTLVAQVTDTDANAGSDSIGVSVDNAALNMPSVSFVAPTDQTTVAGSITIEVAATDPQDAADQLTVDISTDGGLTFTAATYNVVTQNHTLVWDTTTVLDGPETLVANVTDPDLYMTSASVDVAVRNAPPTAYLDAVLASGPDVYWRLDETGGTTAFDLVSGLDGTYSQGPLLGQPGLVADDNTAVDFDGIDDYIAVPDSTLINIGTRTRRTMSVWFRPDDVTARQVIVDEGGAGRGLSIYIDQGQVYLGAWNIVDDFSADTPWGYVFLSAPVTSGEIYNAVAVLDQPTGRFEAYLNGSSIGAGIGGTLHGHGSDTGIGAMNDATAFHDGIGSGNGYYFNGVVDEVAFYNLALDTATISSLYTIGTSQETDPTVAFVEPTEGDFVSGSQLIELAATDPQDDPAVLLVDVSTDGGTSFQPAAFNAGTQRHEYTWDTTAELDGLKALLARVTDTDANVVSRSINVTVSNSGATAVIIAAGDVSTCVNTNDTDTADLIDTIIAGTSLPVTVVPVGDLAYEDGSAQQFTDCYDPTWGRHKAITMPVVGNHEYNTSGASGYYDYFGPVAAPPGGYYRYEVGGWEVFALNSVCGSIGGCDATSAQVQWLRSELAASANTCTLALFHHTRFETAVPADPLVEFWKALYEFNAEVVVSADAHYYAESALQDWEGNLDPINGIRQFVVGTGGRSLRALPASPHANQQVLDNSEFGVLVIELSPTGYLWQFRRVGDGAVMYAGVGTCQ